MHVDVGKPFPEESPKSWNWVGQGALTKVVESLKIGPSVLTGLGWGLVRRWRDWSEASREFTAEVDISGVYLGTSAVSTVAPLGT